MIKKIIVTPREAILPLIERETDKEHIFVISVSSPFGDMLDFSKYLKDYQFETYNANQSRLFDFDGQVIHLEFDDVITNTHGFYQEMSVRQAYHVLETYDEWSSRFEEDCTLYIHCDAGISRSAGIAEALKRKFPHLIVENLRPARPNNLVIRRIFTALAYWYYKIPPVIFEQNAITDMQYFDEVCQEMKKATVDFTYEDYKNGRQYQTID